MKRLNMIYRNRALCSLLLPLLLTTTHDAVADKASGILLNGRVEVEATGGRAANGSANSDITLATVEIGIDTAIHDSVSAHILLLHEEDDTDLELDEGTLTVTQLGGTPIALTAGQMYISFGNFESHMISDPLTLVLGETRESVVQFSAETDGLYGSLFTFKGATRRADQSDRIKSLGANIGFTIENNDFNLDTGISYISNMAETDALEAAVNNSTALTDAPAGHGVYITVNHGPLTLIGEYIGTDDSFAAVDLIFNSANAAPNTYNIETGYQILFFDKESTVALAAQGSREAQALGLPESRILSVITVAIREQTSLSFEWARSEDYAVAEGGTGLSTDTYIAQLAVRF